MRLTYMLESNNPHIPLLYKTIQVWPELFQLTFPTAGTHVVTVHITSIAPPQGFKEWGNLVWWEFKGPVAVAPAVPAIPATDGQGRRYLKAAASESL